MGVWNWPARGRGGRGWRHNNSRCLKGRIRPTWRRKLPSRPAHRTTASFDRNLAMATFIAMLRGINVGGNTLKMERLRDACEELGFKKIRTYVQSGNIVFESTKSEASLAALIEKRLAGECRLAP